jgi:D-apiose dehydrogenase
MTGKVEQTPLRVAVVGAGFVAPHHLAGWKVLPEVELVGLAARDAGRRDDLATRFGIAATYGDVEEMLDAQRPQVLDICTPAELHAAHAAAAAERGIHVLCQKPVAPDMETARAMRETARRQGVRLMVHENFRFRPWYREAKRQLVSGILGEVLYVRSDSRFAGTVTSAEHPETPWSIARQPSFVEPSRLLLLESVIHQIDVCRFLFGEASSVYAQARRVSPQVRGEDLVSLSMRFGEVIAVIERSYAARGYPAPPMTSETLTVEGERGALFIDREGRLRIEIDLPGDRRTLRPEIELEDAYPRSYAATIRHFVTALRAGTPFETDIDDNLHTLDAVMAAYRSLESGEAVQLSKMREALQ